MSRQTGYPYQFNNAAPYSSMGRSPNQSSGGQPPPPGRQSPREAFFDGEDPEDPLAHMRTNFDRDRQSFFTDPDRYRQSPWGGAGPPAGFFRHPRGGFPDSFDQDFSPQFDFPEPSYPTEYLARPHYQRQASPNMKENRRDFQGESIPIRVIHERTKNENGHQRGQHHPATSHRNTTELPAARSPAADKIGSPRLERAHSEPPKNFQQRLFQKPSNYAPIPESSSSTPPPQQQDTSGPEGLQPPRNLLTSASAPSVPSSSSSPNSAAPVPPPRKPSPTKVKQQQEQDNLRKQSAPPGIRHIPIFVEGRDDPVVVRRAEQTKESSFPKPSDYYPAGVKKVSAAVAASPQRPDLPLGGTATARVNVNAEPTSPLSPPPGPIPMGCSASHMNVPAAVNSEKAPEPSSPLPAPKGPIPLPCSPDYMGQDGGRVEVEPTKARSVSPRPAAPQRVESEGSKVVEDSRVDGSIDPDREHQQAARKVSKEEDGGAFEKMQRVKQEVEELIARIDQFKGKKKDKEYLYLDEMLTRHLLALDGIETSGRDDMRQMRKEAIRTINRCLSMLDTRAGAKTGTDAADNDAVLAQLAAQSSVEK